MSSRNTIITSSSVTTSRQGVSNSTTVLTSGNKSITLFGFGIKGDKGKPGQDGTSDKTFNHVQALPSSTWVIIHNLGKYPSVSVTDSTGELVVGGTKYLNLNTVELTFAGAFSGSAHLN